MSKQINRRSFVNTLALGTAGYSALNALAPSASAQQKKKPNVIIIFIDDLGYGDLSSFGSPYIETPNIDRIGREGIRLTDFYSCSSVCTPSRAGLLTGRYQVRSGIVRVLFPRDEVGMPDSEITVAEAMKEQDYATACVGKWHLGHLPPFRPMRHGFDYYYGILYSNDMKNVQIFRNDEVVEDDPVDQSLITKKYTQESVNWIREHKDEPFFLYLAHTMPHVPLFASDEFKGTSKRGLYGDVVEEIDAGVGDILDTLDELDLANDTFICFTSDNGPWLSKKERGGSAGPLRDGKFSVYEGGVREPFLARWPGVIPAGSLSHEPAITLDLFATSIKIAGGQIPDDRPIDGKNILPLLQGKEKSPHDILYFYKGNKLSAIRKGKWKLHYQPGQPIEKAELYNLHLDVSEKYNVAKKNPEILKEMVSHVESWASDVIPKKLEP